MRTRTRTRTLLSRALVAHSPSNPRALFLVYPSFVLECVYRSVLRMRGIPASPGRTSASATVDRSITDDVADRLSRRVASSRRPWPSAQAADDATALCSLLCVPSSSVLSSPHRLSSRFLCSRLVSSASPVAGAVWPRAARHPIHARTAIAIDRCSYSNRCPDALYSTYKTDVHVEHSGVDVAEVAQVHLVGRVALAEVIDQSSGCALIIAPTGH